MSNTIKIPDYELLDLVCLCHAALAQDSPELPSFYVNEILGRLDAFKYPGMREEIEVYLAEKKYLPPLKLIDPNEMKATGAALGEALEQLPDHIVILSALQTNL